MTEEAMSDTQPGGENQRATSVQGLAPANEEAKVQDPQATENKPVTDAQSRMKRQRIWSRVVGSAIAVVGVAAVGGIVAVSALHPLPGISAGQQALQIVPDTTLEQRVCMGSMRQQNNADDASAGKPIADAASNGVVASGAAPAIVDGVSGAPLEPNYVGKPESSAWTRLAVDHFTTPAILQSAKVTSQGAIAGIQTINTNSGGFVGTTITACADPSFSGWLVGGGTTTGRSTVLQLTNPTSGIAKVSLQTYGAQGISSETTEPIEVAPHSTRVLSMVAYSPDSDQLALQYSATGAPVVAFLQQSTVRGLVSGGVSASTVSADAAKSQTVSGVRLTDNKQQNDAANNSGYSDSDSVLRIVNTGSNTKVDVALTDSVGKVTHKSVQMARNSVNDVSLGNLPNGVYTATVSSTQSVVAAARVTSGGTSAPRYSWISSIKPQMGERLLAMPTAVDSATLNISNPTDEDSSVTISIDDAPEYKVALAAHTSADVKTAPGAIVRINAAAAVTNSIGVTGGLGAAVTAVPANSALTGAVSVRP